MHLRMSGLMNLGFVPLRGYLSVLSYLMPSVFRSPILIKVGRASDREDELKMQDKERQGRERGDIPETSLFLNTS
jgi:hypothetical protein